MNPADTLPCSPTYFVRHDPSVAWHRAVGTPKSRIQISACRLVILCVSFLILPPHKRCAIALKQATTVSLHIYSSSRLTTLNNQQPMLHGRPHSSCLRSFLTTILHAFSVSCTPHRNDVRPEALRIKDYTGCVVVGVGGRCLALRTKRVLSKEGSPAI
jgi:hypothetical protein